MQPQFILLSSKARNITSQRFGRLVALGPISRTPRGQVMWLCQCDCGNTTSVRASHLAKGLIQSCGCLRLEKSVAASTKHGMRDTTIYSVWCNIIQRCTNPSNSGYIHYGNRGIAVYPEWRDDFETFYDYVSQLPHYGEEGYSLDRANNSLGYQPGNVRWATKTEQSRNTRSNRLLSYNGKMLCLSAWESELGLAKGQLCGRLRRGWSIERALTTPQKSSLTHNGKTQNISAWSKELNIPENTLRNRISHGWGVERALTTPRTSRIFKRNK